MKMKFVMPVFLLSSFLIVNSPLVFAKDKILLDALNAEAGNTSMEKGEVSDDATSEPSVVPKAITDYNALEKKVAKQIEGLLSGASQNDTNEDSNKQFESALENIVSSALLKGNKLDDIRSAVSTAMDDIKQKSVETGDVAISTIETAGKALKNIVGEASVPRSSIEQLSSTVSEIQTVTVLEGENLYRIAQRVYGSGKRYLELYEANKDTIKDPNIIRLGQVLKLP
jgi:nucleoid-associated protein YgaU